MALIGPILDNRTQQQLRDELVRRIPVYTPEWTNHNESDPGIALLELFAYLGESLLYRFNQVPDSTRIEFLRLLGVQPRPAQPAQVLLSAVTQEPAGVQVLPGSEAAGTVSFQTTDELYVWPLTALGAGKTPLAAGVGAADSKADALERASLDPASAAFYRTALTAADPNVPDAVTIDVSAQLDRSLWVALLAEDTLDLSALSRRTLFVGVAFEERFDDPPVLAQLGDDFRAGALTEDPRPVQWQLWTGTDPTGSAVFTPLNVVGDTTHGMITTGVVKLELPDRMPILRSLGGGVADNPPVLDDEDVRQRVVAWLRVRRPATNDVGDAIHRVRWVGANCVQAEQSRTPPPELLGSGTGDADQRFPLTHSPVLDGTVRLQVEEPQGWVDWDEVDNFARSTLETRHYTVDHAGGAVVFGRARVPQLGERIRVLSYRYSDGAKGNLPPGDVTSFPVQPAVTVTNPFPAVGGADTAPLPDALAAIPGEVHRRDRAVVAEDFQALAKITGVARVEVLSTFHPDFPTEDTAGVTTLVILPDEDVRNPDAPVADLGLLRRVAIHLEPRRLVTAELYVIPPEYVALAVSIGVEVRKGYPVDAIRRWVEKIVRQYLSAVPPNGPDGAGWPLGRTVRAAELEAVAVQVEGVEYVVRARLAAVSVAADGTQVAEEVDWIVLQKWQLPEIVAIDVTRGEPIEPGTVPQDPPGQVPVPLPPEVC
ncbi:MAG: putative baseplate assembly protein [Micropruina sp.]